MVTCGPVPCVVDKWTASGRQADGIIGGYTTTPDAFVAVGVAGRIKIAGVTSLSSSPSARGAAPTGAVAASETITVTGSVISATAVTTASLATPDLPASDATAADAIGSTAQNGAVLFTDVPVLPTSPYTVVVTTQSTQLDRAVRFRFMRPKARLRP